MKFLLRISARLCLQLAFLLVLYFASRLGFTLINLRYFPEMDARVFFELAFYGTRFDLSAILLTNLLYITLFLLPIYLWRMPRWEKMVHWIFVVINATVFLFELSDWAYFPFNHKRSTADVLDMVTRKGDFLSQLPTFIVDYWYVPFAWVVLLVLLHAGNRAICKRTPLVPPTIPSRFAVGGIQFLFMAVFITFTVIGIRGGTQLKPIVLSDAMKYAKNEFVPVVLNTPFSIIASLSNNKLPEVQYMEEAELKKYLQLVKRYPSDTFRKKNVVVIILESFSKEFTSLGKGQSRTPFLDSLMKQSLTCTHAYANALRSAEGIPAIIAGIPSLMEEPITTSRYGNNKLSALPGLLKNQGYTSAFYHGGSNGTMSFDIFCKNAGFDKYYGRDEYNNEADYDGNWGIWDEPFLQFFAKGLNDMPQPFFATVFTLSSHPPYGIPESYRKLIPAGKSPVDAAVTYTDMALRKFFETAARQDWFHNTLFVLTADHISMHDGNNVTANDHMELYSIPILYYAPGDSTVSGTFDSLTQQIDILPSVLDHLGYEHSFFAFGNSIFATSDRFVINAINNSYCYLKDGYLLTTNGVTPESLYACPADSNYQQNLISSETEKAQERLAYLKAFIQSYNKALNTNKMWVNPW